MLGALGWRGLQSCYPSELLVLFGGGGAEAVWFFRLPVSKRTSSTLVHVATVIAIMAIRMSELDD
jgi:hypothetical protein